MSRPPACAPGHRSLPLSAPIRCWRSVRSPLDGAYPAGVVRVRGAARLVLQTPDGKSVSLRPGQSWQGWRLISIGADDVRFRRGGENVTLAFGAPDSFSYPVAGPQAYDPGGFDDLYRPNQADEQ